MKSFLRLIVITIGLEIVECGINLKTNDKGKRSIGRGYSKNKKSLKRRQINSKQKKNIYRLKSITEFIFTCLILLMALLFISFCLNIIDLKECEKLFSILILMLRKIQV
jgi:hypothetical protein